MALRPRLRLGSNCWTFTFHYTFCTIIKIIKICKIAPKMWVIEFHFNSMLPHPRWLRLTYDRLSHHRLIGSFVSFAATRNPPRSSVLSCSGSPFNIKIYQTLYLGGREGGEYFDFHVKRERMVCFAGCRFYFNCDERRLASVIGGHLNVSPQYIANKRQNWCVNRSNGEFTCALLLVHCHTH